MTITVTEKRCRRCGETKSVDGFHRNRSKRDGLATQCKECQRAYCEAHREESRAYARNRHALLGNPTYERWQEIAAKHATRRGRWSEAEDAYLATSTDRIVDDALALKRTHKSVETRLTRLRRRGVTLARDRALAA